MRTVFIVRRLLELVVDVRVHDDVTGGARQALLARRLDVQVVLLRNVHQVVPFVGLDGADGVAVVLCKVHRDARASFRPACLQPAVAQLCRRCQASFKFGSRFRRRTRAEEEGALDHGRRRRAGAFGRAGSDSRLERRSKHRRREFLVKREQEAAEGVFRGACDISNQCYKWLGVRVAF
jgi:hypothetical protein